MNKKISKLISNSKLKQLLSKNETFKWEGKTFT